MARDPLPDRRSALTLRVKHFTGLGREVHMLVTFGLDGAGQVREAFCADFKAGSDHQTLMGDACVLYSLLLQHGMTAAELRAKLAEPRSFIGTIADTAAGVEEKKG